MGTRNARLMKITVRAVSSPVSIAGTRVTPGGLARSSRVLGPRQLLLRRDFNLDAKAAGRRDTLSEKSVFSCCTSPTKAVAGLSLDDGSSLGMEPVMTVMSFYLSGFLRDHWYSQLAKESAELN
jgi:hypothetical protein